MLETALQKRWSLGRYRDVAPVDRAADGRRAAAGGLLRGALWVGCVLSLCAALHWGDPGGYTHADPALARLLRGMALIKGMIALAIVAAVWWRFGRTVSTPAAVSYLVGSWILAGSTGCIWQLSWIAPAAVLFHAAAVAMLIVGWRER